MVHQIAVESRKAVELIEITERIQSVVTQSGVDNGECVVFVPHTTAGITINENADPDVAHDLIQQLARVVPADGAYRHAEGNSDAHVKALLTGSQAILFVERGRLVLGPWQGVYFAEFDGPRSRRVMVKVRAG